MKMTDATSEEMLNDSKMAGALFRGLPASYVRRPRGVFRYANYLDRPYIDDVKNIDTVVFNISRFGKYKHELVFSNKVSEKEAIETVERYLSKPLREIYYNNIKDDLFHNAQWDEAKTFFVSRGDCLTDSVFLEETTIKDGQLSFFIGS